MVCVETEKEREEVGPTRKRSMCLLSPTLKVSRPPQKVSGPTQNGHMKAFGPNKKRCSSTTQLVLQQALKLFTRDQRTATEEERCNPEKKVRDARVSNNVCHAGSRLCHENRWFRPKISSPRSHCEKYVPASQQCAGLASVWRRV